MSPDALDGAYQDALDAALSAPATRRLPSWQDRPRLPPAIRGSLLEVIALEGGLPESLAAHYLREAPEKWVDQRLRGRSDDPARALLQRPIAPGELPGFEQAVEGSCALLREGRVEPEALLGAGSAPALLAGAPNALQLSQRALLSCGLPLLGAGQGERGETARLLEARKEAGKPGAEAAVLDLRLGQHLVHELLHGPLREQTGPTPPWMILEAAALWLQAQARPAHVFPGAAFEAVPGVSLFVRVGEGLAAALGLRSLVRLLTEPQRFAERLGQRAGTALSCAGLQEWLRVRAPPFAREALEGEAWMKLLWAAGAPFVHAGPVETGKARLPVDRFQATPGAGPPTPPLPEALRALLEEAQAKGPRRAAREGPALLAAAAKVPWEGLGWWWQEAGPAELGRTQTAVGALFQENAMAPLFLTRPAEPPQGLLLLDVAACELSARRRPGGVFAEPSRWTLPPPVCRLLHARGLRKLALTGARRAASSAIAAQLWELAHGAGGLPEQLELASAGAP
jgi:hypothetical protein